MEAGWGRLLITSQEIIATPLLNVNHDAFMSSNGLLFVINMFSSSAKNTAGQTTADLGRDQFVSELEAVDLIT